MKIAIVGSGISGLAAGWLLEGRHEVHLFEADSRLGGHANTVIVDDPQGKVAMDTGFLVYNELTYPNLVDFFAKLGVETVDSDMSLSIQVKEKNLEWMGSSLARVFGQRRNLFRPRFHLMLSEILRFNRDAEKNLELAKENRWSLGELLENRKFSTDFYEDYLLPCGAAIWSTPELEMLAFPAATFLTFFINHKLLQVAGRPIWRTVKGGSIHYVEKVARHIPHVHLSTPVKSVQRKGGHVVVSTDTEDIRFDKVIMATHAPISARLVRASDPNVMRILASIRYEKNKAILHRDASLMPKRKRCWASWNAVGTLCEEKKRKVLLTYYLNRLQPLETKRDYFVTLNPSGPISDVIMELDYSHPQFDARAIEAQAEVPSIQGVDGIYFAGAWTRYGFHEDGFLSAIKAVEKLEEDVRHQSRGEAHAV